MPSPSSPFIVAELSANHNGSLDRALDIVEAAAQAGADAIKRQTWSPGTMCVDKTYRLASGPWKGRTLFDLYAQAHTPWEWHDVIFDFARLRGLVPFSAAFDKESVDFLETLDVDRHKVASFELTDLPLIRYMASKGKPMILSTGMSSWREMFDAIEATSPVPDGEVTLLKCTSAYPADASDANLASHAHFDWPHPWGVSDHSLGIGVAIAAVALGATYIEKHLTLRRSDGGLDSGFSMEPHEFAQMVEECRRAAQAIGVPSYGPGPSESTALRRSLWVIRDCVQGEPLILGVNVATARPAKGMPPDTDLHDARASQDMRAGTPLTSFMRMPDFS
jgi:pseudaminic acid synthase